MDLFPFRNNSDVGSDELPLFIEYAWDFVNDCHIIENDELKKVTGNDAIKVWAYKALRVPRYRHLAFSWQYGSEIESLVGKVMSHDQLVSEVEKNISETLKISPYILSVKDFDIDFSDDVPKVFFTLVTVYGEVRMDV